MSARRRYTAEHQSLVYWRQVAKIGCLRQAGIMGKPATECLVIKKSSTVVVAVVVYRRITGTLLYQILVPLSGLRDRRREGITSMPAGSVAL